MLDSLESLGLQTQAAHGVGADGTSADVGLDAAQPAGDDEEQEGASPVPQRPLARETATIAQLAEGYERARRSLSWESVADLPEEKRAVASELSRALASAYEAERIVLEETERVAREEEDV